MRAKEFINEAIDSMQDEVAHALPATYSIPKLSSQDAYSQYRFGVAIAKAKGNQAADSEFNENPWGHYQVVVSYSNTVDEYIDDALKSVGLKPSDKKLISTRKSEESKLTGTTSPVAKPKKNRYGV